MAQVKVFYEPEMELLTVFWQSPRPHQICTELGMASFSSKMPTVANPLGWNCFPTNLVTLDLILLVSKLGHLSLQLSLPELSLSPTRR
jgi:hypothetical protein